MKWIACIALIVIGLLAQQSPALAQVFYVFPDAPVVEQKRLVIGTHLGVGDDDLVRWQGYGRLGITKYVDVGTEILFDRVGGDWLGGLGVDAKLAAFPETNAIPFDLSMNLGLGFESGGDTAILQIPIGGIISSPFKLESEKWIVPYVGVYLLIVQTKSDPEGGPKVSDTDIDVEARGGVRYTLGPRLNLYVTLQLGRDTILYLGVNYKL